MAKILIVGCGKIGQPLANQLIADDHQVTGIRRNPPKCKDRIIWAQMDITEKESLRILPTDFDQITIILTPAERSEQAYTRIYQHGIENLIQHFTNQRRHPSCLFVSATSVYGQQHGEWVDEKSETSPTSYNGKSLLAAEQTITDFSENPLIIRFSGIYGTQRTRILKQLDQPLEIQQLPPLFTNRIHQDDCIGVLYHFVTGQLRNLPLHPVYIATDHDCAEKYEMMSWLSTKAGLAPPKPVCSPPDSIQNKRCSNRQLLNSGYRFKYQSYREGYSALLP